MFRETRGEHDQRLKAVFDRCVKVNLKANARKCRFVLPELPWIEHVISFQQKSRCNAIILQSVRELVSAAPILRFDRKQVTVETNRKPLVGLLEKSTGLFPP